MTRGERAQELAMALGAKSVQGPADPPPVSLDAAILFAPVGDLVPPALEALDRGGTLAIAGIHLSDIPVLEYQRHLFQERQVRSVRPTRGPTHASSWRSRSLTTSRSPECRTPWITPTLRWRIWPPGESRVPRCCWCDLARSGRDRLRRCPSEVGVLLRSVSL